VSNPTATPLSITLKTMREEKSTMEIISEIKGYKPLDKKLWSLIICAGICIAIILAL